MEFKKLELEQKNSFKRLLSSADFKKTIALIALGLAAGTLYFWFGIGKEQEIIDMKLLIKYAVTGGFLGFFISNSPCARNKC